MHGMVSPNLTTYTQVQTKLVQSLSATIDSHFSFHRFAWSPDGSTFVAQISSSDNCIFAAWRSDTWEKIERVGQFRIEGQHHLTAGLAFDPNNHFVALGGSRGLEVRSLNDFNIVFGSKGDLTDVTWAPNGSYVIAALGDEIEMIDARKWKRFWTQGPKSGTSVSWNSHHSTLAVANDSAVELWDVNPWLLKTRWRILDRTILQMAWNPLHNILALGSTSSIVSILDGETLVVRGELERHSDSVAGVAYSPDGKLLATASDDGHVCLWDSETYNILAEINVPAKERKRNSNAYASVAFHPTLPLIAIRNSATMQIELWEYGMGEGKPMNSILDQLQYANAKIVLLGDSGVGKSGLSLALTGQRFQPTESTHGRRVWPFTQERGKTPKGVLQARESLLWDLAGQPGYRLVHQLHLQGIAVAVLVFDSRSELDPFGGVRYWDRALRQASRFGTSVPLKKLLVAARVDRGGIGVSRERIEALIKELGVIEYFETSAKDGTGILALRDKIEASIAWDELPTVSSNQLFQNIKEFIINEKNEGTRLIDSDDLYRRYKKNAGAGTSGGERDFDGCISRMESRDLIRRFSFGNLLLLKPELLDAYASALVNAAKDEPDGMGHIAEEIALAGRFQLSEDEKIKNKEQERLLMIATVEELLRHEIVLRESTEGGPYLIFPSQFTREHPDFPDPSNKAIIFTFEGAVLSIYSTLVVRFSHTGFFKKQELWKNAAKFSSAAGGNCGLTFREIGEGNAEMVLFFDDSASEETRFQFEEYVRSHVERRALPSTVRRRRIFICQECGTPISDLQARRRRERGESTITCNVCESIISLLDREERLKSIDPKMVATLDRRADAKRNLEAATAVLRGKMETQDFDVFLAHSSRDKNVVETIAAKLRDAGINPWLDKEQIPPGRWFQDVIQQVIPKVKSAAIFIGPHGIGPWEAVELRSFISQCVDRKLPVIPVLLPGVSSFPPDLVFLRELHGIRFESMEDHEALKNFRWGITGQKPSDLL